MIERQQEIFEGKREDILKQLSKMANKNCKKCYGRGYIGYTEEKNGRRNYIVCPKCINKTKSIPKGFSLFKKNIKII